MDYYKNNLRKECIAEYFDTFRYTLDALEFVPEKYLLKVHRQIFSDMMHTNKEIDREYRRYKWQKFWQGVKDRRAERKTKRAEARAQRKARRAEARAQRKARRTEARVQRKTKRAEVRAERKAKKQAKRKVRKEKHVK